MKTYGSILGTALGVVVFAFFTLSCSDVSFQTKKTAEASCVGNGCATPYTYAWFEAGFGNCSVPCGGGMQTQSVTCRRSDGVTVSESNCSGTKPSSSQQCNIQQCTSTYSWNVGGWGICSQSCGGGTQTRSVICQDSSGSNVADGYCTASKPALSRTCNTQSCPDSYGWQWVPNQCSKNCGGGFEKYICVDGNNHQVADSLCTSSKPQMACNTQACPIQHTYSWYTGGWGVCSKSCGGGTRTREVLCKDEDGQSMADVYCAGQSQPAGQEACNTQTCPDTGRSVTTTMTLPQPAVDVIMIVDDSSSMLPDNTKLAAKMAGFLTDLDNANVDYRVCVTSTDVRPLKPAGAAPGPYGWHGMPLTWGHYSGSTWVSSGSILITKATPNKAQLFNDTIKFIGAGYSSDEQGIGALSLMLDGYFSSGCFRQKSTLATILISDEDERSVGGQQSWSPAQYEPLTSINYPDNLISKVASKFNSSSYTKPFIWNSIIVKPGDTACEATQDAQGTPCFFGTLYNELSNKTSGHVGSICDGDYSQSLKYVKDRVVQTMPYVQLECVPTNTPTVTLSPNRSTSISTESNRVHFSPALPEGTTVTVQYRCAN
jgi:hypothetical protein